MLLQIITHTPLFVWALLAGLVALGWRQTRTRQVVPRQVLMLPAAMLGLGLWSLVPGLQTNPSVALLWLAALALGAAGGLRTPQVPGTAWLADEGHFRVPGSWVPMGFIVVIFMMRYALGAGTALHPEWRADLSVQGPLAGLFGALAGLSLGRALGLLRLAGGARATIGAHA
jgi:hypothetical protein